MTPLEQARADLDTACREFNAAANTSTPPDRLERAVRRAHGIRGQLLRDGPVMNHQLEMIYTRYSEACKDPHIDPTGTLRECRRTGYHDGPHASDYPYQEWTSHE